VTLSRTIAFRNREGMTLRGILSEPDPAISRGACVLLLSPGIKGRVGPHRLYLKIAARLIPLGFHVLRFDYSGLGDSEGYVDERMLVDVYNTIHAGRYVDDTICAMDWMQQEVGVSRFIGSGLCGGSISALLAAKADSRIECLLGIGLPTVLEGGPENWAKALTHHQAAALRGRYVRKLLDPKAWTRLVSGRTNYEALWKVVKKALPVPAAPKPAPGPSKPADTDRTNPHFASAFWSMLSTGRPMLLIFSGADRLRYQFAENFESHHAARLEPFQHLYEVHVIEKANHVLSSAAWVDELGDVAGRWLSSRYPAN